MSVEEIVSDECFVGWPTFWTPRANRQTAFHFVGPRTMVCIDEREDGSTIIRERTSITEYPAQLQPVIIRRTR